MSSLPAVIRETRRDVPADAVVIWLHGLGADGNDFAPIVPELRLPADMAVRFIFPHAPSIPVTINQGYVMPAWYDIRNLSDDSRVDAEGLRKSAAAVHEIIEEQVQAGIASQRIVLGGFSQGGAVVLEAALSCVRPLAGVMSLSSYFPTADTVVVNPVNAQLPIRVFHGTQDTVVAESLGKLSVTRLQEKGFKPAYSSYPMQHSVCPEQIRDIAAWLQSVLLR
jgi:phospholipase/carboxylesterase